MKRALALACTALLAPAAVAAAQFSTGNSLVVFGGSGKTLAEWQGAVTPSGALVIAYHGDREAGCAAHGLCDTSGTVVWTPTAEGTAALLEVRVRRHVVWSGAISLNTFFDPAGMTVVSRRARADGSAATCLDAVGAPSFLHVGSGRASIPIALVSSSGFGSSGFTGRCAGPTIADLRAALPEVRIAARTLRRGATLDLSSERSFRAAGFAGTVSSTLMLRVARMTRVPSSSSQIPRLPPNIRPRKRTIRTVTVGYRVTKVSGGVTLALRGDPDGGCELLDSCQATGSLVISPSAHGAGAFLSATSESPPARGFRDLRQAVGLLPGPARSNTHPSGTVSLSRGALSETLDHGDGATCTDQGRGGGFEVVLNLGATPVTARLLDDSDSPPRTRCPGPVFTGRALLTGTLGRSELRRPGLTIHLSRPRTLADDGWLATGTGGLTITLRRTGIRQHQGTFTDFP